MARLSLFLSGLATGLAAATAHAGETACRFDAGVLVVPAEVAGIAGDYIFDTGAARTALHETTAHSEGIAAEALSGDVRLAGMVWKQIPLEVADLDVRGWNLSTPLAGIIGVDVLRRYVVDVTYAPCRITLSRPGRGSRRGGYALPLRWDLGRPTVRATVSDDVHQITGDFVVATGANAPVRLADDLAQAPGAALPAELYPDGVWLARLPRVVFAGAEGRDVAAGLMRPEGEAAGVLGGEVLARFRLSFDFPAGRLLVAPAPKQKAPE